MPWVGAAFGPQAMLGRRPTDRGTHPGGTPDGVPERARTTRIPYGAESPSRAAGPAPFGCWPRRLRLRLCRSGTGTSELGQSAPGASLACAGESNPPPADSHLFLKDACNLASYTVVRIYESLLGLDGLDIDDLH